MAGTKGSGRALTMNEQAHPVAVHDVALQAISTASSAATASGLVTITVRAIAACSNASALDLPNPQIVISAPCGKCSQCAVFLISTTVEKRARGFSLSVFQLNFQTSRRGNGETSMHP